MKLVRNLILTLTIGATAGFAIEKGPIYMENKHYKIGKDNREKSKEYKQDYEVRLWAISNFGKSFNINKISKETSQKVGIEGKTHGANNWYWLNVENNQYLMIGYANSTTGEYAQALAKKVGNKWFYTCNAEKWYDLEDGKSASCSARVGFDTIKLQFANPLNDKGWSVGDVMYRFVLKDR